MTCFNCQSEYHFSGKCELKASGKENKKKKENLSNADTMLSVLLKQRAKGVCYYRESNEEEVMVTHDEEELCFLLEEAGIRGVLDTACSKSVAGLKWISKYTEDLPQDITESLKLQPSSKIYQFGGGEKRKSMGCVKLPTVVGDKKIILTVEVVDAFGIC